MRPTPDVLIIFNKLNFIHTLGSLQYCTQGCNSLPTNTLILLLVEGNLEVLIISYYSMKVISI